MELFLIQKGFSIFEKKSNG